VSDELALQAPRHALVKQQSQIERVEILLITPTLQSLLAGYYGKIIKEDFKAVSAFQVIE